MHRLLRERGYREAIRGGCSPEGGLSGFTPVKRFHRFRGANSPPGPNGRVAFSKLYVFYPPWTFPESLFRETWSALYYSGPVEKLGYTRIGPGEMPEANPVKN